MKPMLRFYYYTSNYRSTDYTQKFEGDDQCDET